MIIHALNLSFQWKIKNKFVHMRGQLQFEKFFENFLVAMPWDHHGAPPSARNMLA